jgi:competence protein ComEA
MEKVRNIALIVAGVLAAFALAAFFSPHRSETTVSAETPSMVPTVPPQLAVVGAQATPDGSVGTPPPAPTRVVVYVCGSVKHPGVYDMAAGSRVADGIDRAGGALGDADLEQLNLAQPLADAMKIDVPRKGEHPLVASGLESAPSSTGTSSSRRRHGGRSSHKLQPGQTLDVNTASEAELTQLPGVGPSLAARILEYRTENGPFQSIDDLQNVSGIGPSKLDKMAPYVRL